MLRRREERVDAEAVIVVHFVVGVKDCIFYSRIAEEVIPLESCRMIGIDGTVVFLFIRFVEHRCYFYILEGKVPDHHRKEASKDGMFDVGIVGM